LIAAAIALACSLGGAASASAYVYWVNGYGAIGRANLDGTGMDPSFITGLSYPRELALDSNYIFWSDTTGALGRANIDGTGIVGDLLGGPSVAPLGLAAAGRQIYWSSQLGPLGHASLDGSHQARNLLIPGAYPAGEVAVDRAHIYWIDGSPKGGIGRANLDGSGVNAGFIATPTYLFGLALGPAGNYIYWSNGVNAIGRATYAGGSVDPTFITGADQPAGVAIYGRHIYWANAGNGTIGRANLDGTDVQENFITGLNTPTGIAVDGGPAGTATASQGGLWFASRAVGTASRSKVLTVTNTGAGVLNVKAAKLTSGATADFEISGDRCSGSELQPGASCKLDVRFGPTTGGPHRATLTVTSNDPAGPLELALAGGTGWTLRLAVSGTAGIIGTEATIAAVANNFVGETPYRINIYANRTLLGTCTTGDQCSMPFSPAPPYPQKVVIEADVAPAHAKPFGKHALVSRKTTASFMRTRPPSCQPLTCQ
jgi:hypothetical protein